MAFENEKLAPGSVGMAGTPKRWVYGLSLDTLVTMSAADYFLNAPLELEQGDIIYAVSNFTDPYDEAEFVVDNITLDNDGNRAGMTVKTYSSASSTSTFLTIESPAFDTTDTIYTGAPLSGTITNIRAILNGANTTAAVTLTFKIGGVAITDGTLTFGATEPVGFQLVTEPTALNTFNINNSIECECSGGGAAITATVIYTISPSA